MRTQRAGVTNPKLIAARERAIKAVELRLSGLDFTTIAAMAGYNSRQAAWRAVMAHLKRRTEQTADKAALEMLGRLDAQVKAIWPQVLGGDVAAGYLALQIETRRAKLLGLDKPPLSDLEKRLREAAEELGLDPADAVAAAQRIVRASAG